jgi:outer membrane protein assembly factor BamA
MLYMRALLNSLGYYRDSITFHSKVDTASNDQYRTTVNFQVFPGKITTIDSIQYNLIGDTTGVSPKYMTELQNLQHLTDSTLPQAVVKKGDAFSKYGLSAERDRLADVYRNNGYLRYSQEEMLVLWDTVGIALIRPTLDPIEQARQLAELRRRRQNPTAEVEFRLRNSPDSTRITRYYVGNVTVFPDLTPDTGLYRRTVREIKDYKFVTYQNLFKPEKLTDYIFLNHGDLYRQSQYLKTQNKFSSLGAWRLVSINQFPREGQDTVDFELRMTPAKKYAFNINVEGSRNQGNLNIAEGNLIGLGVNLALNNRNFARAANQARTNFRYGAELNATTANLVQTQQITLSNTIQFPRMVPYIKGFFNPLRDNEVRSIFAVNIGNTDRINYFNVSSFNTSWAVEKSWNNKLLGIRLPNIEYNLLFRGDSLKKLIDSNRTYAYIFNTGFIASSIINYNIAGTKKNTTSLLSTSLEVPILPFHLGNDLYRFIKLDGEYRRTHSMRRTAFAWRVFGGVGLGMPFFPTDSINFFLPFYRSYYAGGPNSMRAWGIRKLGPGSSTKSFARTEAPDRFGDLRLEANAEYRFFVANLPGVTVNSALFTDIGNVWFLRENKDFPGGEFRFDKLGKDIAIGLGTGLRFDFGGFLKVRFDYAYKVKDPTPEDPKGQNKWFYGWQVFNGQFQLGIDYPF